jgi:hypothetical protein
MNFSPSCNPFINGLINYVVVHPIKSNADKIRNDKILKLYKSNNGKKTILTEKDLTK